MRVARLSLSLLLSAGGCSNSNEPPQHNSLVSANNRNKQALLLDENYKLVMTTQEITCEHPKWKRQAVRWDQIIRIWFVTTSEGPWQPDQWLLFESKGGSCLVPTEAEGIEKIWDELAARFPGFNFKPIALGGINDAKHLCWERRG